MPSSRGSSQPRDGTQVSHNAADSLLSGPSGKPSTSYKWNQTVFVHIQCVLECIFKVNLIYGGVWSLDWEDSPGGGHGNPLQCSCLKNAMDKSLAGYSSWGHKEVDTTEAT